VLPSGAVWYRVWQSVADRLLRASVFSAFSLSTAIRFLRACLSCVICNFFFMTFDRNAPGDMGSDGETCRVQGEEEACVYARGWGVCMRAFSACEEEACVYASLFGMRAFSACVSACVYVCMGRQAQHVCMCVWQDRPKRVISSQQS